MQVFQPGKALPPGGECRPPQCEPGPGRCIQRAGFRSWKQDNSECSAGCLRHCALFRGGEQAACARPAEPPVRLGQAAFPRAPWRLSCFQDLKYSGRDKFADFVESSLKNGGRRRVANCRCGCQELNHACPLFGSSDLVQPQFLVTLFSNIAKPVIEHEPCCARISAVEQPMWPIDLR